MTVSSMDWKTTKLNLAGIADDSIVDGPGIRVAFFAQGCPRRCPGCHNPGTHAFGTGADYTLDELYTRVRRNPLARGVTLSGGEPFSQAAGFALLARKLKAEGYELAAYTGYTLEQLLDSGTAEQRELLETLDVLIDGEFLLAEKNLDLRWRGSENQRILDVPASLAAGRAVFCENSRWL